MLCRLVRVGSGPEGVKVVFCRTGTWKLEKLMLGPELGEFPLADKMGDKPVTVTIKDRASGPVGHAPVATQSSKRKTRIPGPQHPGPYPPSEVHIVQDAGDKKFHMSAKVANTINNQVTVQQLAHDKIAGSSMGKPHKL